MLTDAASTVDGRHASPREGFWLSVSALAARDQVSKQAVSKNIKRWAGAGEIISTRKDGRALLINVAEYDRAKGDLVDQAKLQGELTKKGLDLAPAQPGDRVYTREQARHMAYQADLRHLELDEKLGKLVRIDALEQAAVDCGEALVRALDQIVTRADEVAAAVAKDGTQGARAILKLIARDLRTRAAEEFSKLPTLSTAPATAPPETDA